MLDNRQIEIIDTIAKAKNITKASNILYTAQPNLSRSLKKIEYNLGFKIFDRTKNPIEFTDEGKILYSYIQKIKNLENEMYDEIRKISNLNKNISLGSLSLLYQYLIPEIVPEFLNIYPNINLKLKKYSSESIENAILNKDVDLFITNKRIKNEKISSSFVLKDKICLAIPKDERFDDKKTLYDFIDEKFYLLSNKQNMGKISYEIFKNYNFYPKNSEIVINMASALSMVKAHKGVSFIYKSSIDFLGRDKYRFLEINGDYSEILILYKDFSHKNIIDSISDLIKKFLIL